MAAAYDIEDVVNCPICYDILDDPRTLECGHTFCCKCIQKWYQKEAQTTADSIRCPNCKRTTIIPGRDVTKLPKVYMIHDVVNKFQRQASIGTACQICLDSSTQSEAFTFCKSCDKMFCDQCCARHNEKFTSHRLTRLCSSEEKITGCPTHKNEPLKHMCTTCATLICTVCVLSNKPNAGHSNHKVIPIEDANEYCIGKITKEKPVIDKNLIKTKAAVEEVRNILFNLTTSVDSAKDKIRFLADDLILTVQQWEERSLAKLEDEKAKVSAPWDKKLVSLLEDGMKDELALGSIGIIKNQKSTPVKDCVYLVKEIANRKLSMSDEKLTLKGNTITKTTDSTIAATLKTMLNNEHFYSTKAIQKSVKARPAADYEDVILTQKPKQIWMLNKLGSGEDELRSPISVSFRDDNSLIVCEVENKRVSVFQYHAPDNTVTFIKCLTISKTIPKAAIADEEGRYYVVDSNTATILVFDNNGHGIISIGANKFVHPRCIAFLSGNRLVVGDSGQHKVMIFGRNGEYLKLFGSKGDGSDQFRAIISIASDSNDRIIVADRDLNMVKIFNDNGQLLMCINPVKEDGYCKPRFSLGLTSVATDQDDNIYIAMHGYHKVVKYKSDGTPVLPQPFLNIKDGIKYPCGIAMSKDQLVAVAESSVTNKHAAVRIFRI